MWEDEVEKLKNSIEKLDTVKAKVKPIDRILTAATSMQAVQATPKNNLSDVANRIVRYSNNFEEESRNTFEKSADSGIIEIASNSHKRNIELERIIGNSITADKPVFAEDLRANFLKIKPVDGKYILALHGDSQSVYLNNTRVNERVLANIIKSRKDYNGEEIILISCNTGNEENAKVCFAQKLADELGVSVQIRTRGGLLPN